MLRVPKIVGTQHKQGHSTALPIKLLLWYSIVITTTGGHTPNAIVTKCSPERVHRCEEPRKTVLVVSGFLVPSPLKNPQSARAQELR
jgi:hypothetical protein